MADTLVGTINILVNHNSHTAGDVITVYYDPDTTSYTVYEDTGGGATLVTTLTGLFPNRTTKYFERVDTGFEYQSDTNIITYFIGYTSFPFYLTRTKEIIPTGVNDLVLGVDSIIRASASGTNDGSVTLVATGTNTPIQYSLNDSTYQDSVTFSNLYPANYTFYAKDSLGYKRSINIYLPYDEIPVEASTHGLKYKHQFIESRPDGGSRDGTIHKLEIYQRGYSSSVTNVDAGSDPVIISARGEGSLLGVDTNIVSHELQINLLSTTAKQFHEFATGDEYEWLVLYSIDDSVAQDGSDFNIRFRGYITPETYTEQFGNPPYIVSFSANDRLADLQSIGFYESRVVDEFGIAKNQPVNGILREAYIIDKCLKNIKMNQGYRIAIDMFDSGMNSTSTDTPIHQAYADCSMYYDGNTADSCADVISKILRPYEAILISYQNYFYIIKLEQLQSTSVSYVQFTTIDGTPSSGSFNPRISFKATGNTDLFRFSGNQSLEFTRPIKYVNIISNGIKRDTGIISSWNDSTIIFNEGQFVGYKDFNLVVGNSVYSKEYINGDDYGWAIDFYADTASENSSSYIRSSKNISYTRADKLKIDFDIRIDAYKELRSNLYAPPAAYIPLKWRFKLGTNYLQADGSWDTTETINQFFFTDINTGSFKNYSIEVNFPETATTVTSNDYDLRIYGATVWEYDIYNASQSTAIDTLEAVTTSTLVSGERRIVRWEDSGDYVYFYYELREVLSASDATKGNLTEVRPDDMLAANRGMRWFLLSSWSDTIANPFFTYSTFNIIKDVNIKTLPGGQEPPDQFGETNIISDNNTIDLTIDLFNIDLSNQVNNDENIYTNFTRLSDGTPTGSWTRLSGLIPKTRQSHLKDRIYELYKEPRYKMNVSFYSDLEISFLKHLYTASDDGRIYVLNGIEINPKTGLHSGEILEIYNTGQPVVGEFNNDFDTDNEFA